MKHTSGATTRFTFFATSHKQRAHKGSVFLPFLTQCQHSLWLRPATLHSLCLSHQISPSSPGLQQSPELAASLPPQQPSCSALGVMGTRGLGQVGTLQACPDPELLCVATSSPQSICWEQGAEFPPFPRGSELRALGHVLWQHQPAPKWRGWADGRCLHVCGGKEQAQTFPAGAQIQHWELGSGRAAGLLPSPRTWPPGLCVLTLFCVPP